MAPVVFYCEPEEIQFDGSDSSFLEACSMCEKRLTLNDDVFMYKGISAFCSDECRERQIELDNQPRRRPTVNCKVPASSGAAAAAAGGPVRTRAVTAA